MNISYDIKGLQGIEDALSAAGPKIARATLRKGLEAGTKVFLDAVKERTPIAKEGTPQRRAGELRDAMTSKVTLSGSQQNGTAVVGAEYKKEDGQQSPGVYNTFVEFGSIHGSAQPHMRPGFDAAKDRAIDAFTAVVREGVDSLGK